MCSGQQQKVLEIYDAIIEVVRQTEYDDKNNKEGDETTSDMLTIRRNDIMKTDCPIVFAGKQNENTV